MLSPEHVRTRRRGNELKLLPLEGALRERATELAAELIALTSGQLGRARDELYEAWSSIEAAPRERRLLAGLQKLVEDACEFETADGGEPAALRAEVFLLAAERRSRGEGDFERDRVLAEVAARHAFAPEVLETLLYADLRGAHRLVRFAAPSAPALVEAYDRAQVQAVLLRAVRVVADVRGASPDAYRDLFQRLKFRRLLHQVEAREGGGYRISIDGPFSLFQSVAKYGLELALVLPALEAMSSLELSAEVRWSERQRPLLFRYVSNGGGSTRAEGTELRSEVSELLEALRGQAGEFRARRAERVLNLPGVGLCVPDLVLERTSDGSEVLVEILGYWSRQSVFRRIELAERGLSARVLFVVSSRLRVSEELLEGTENAALYVYKGRINPRALLRHAEALAGPIPTEKS